MKLTLAQRLMSIILCAILALAVVGIVGVFQIRGLSEDLNTLNKFTVPSILTLDKVESELLKIRILALQMMG